MTNKEYAQMKQRVLRFEEVDNNIHLLEDFSYTCSRFLEVANGDVTANTDVLRLNKAMDDLGIPKDNLIPLRTTIVQAILDTVEDELKVLENMRDNC